MSTKTSIKRVALVAVSALGFGLLSVVPSSAAVTAIAVTAPSVSRASASGTIALTVTNTGAIAAAGGESYKARVLAVPASATGNTVEVGDTFAADIEAGIADDTDTTVTIGADNTVDADLDTSAGDVCSDSSDFGALRMAGDAVVGANVGDAATGTGDANGDTDVLVADNETACAITDDYINVAGTYTVFVWNDANDDNAIGAAEKSVRVSFVVGGTPTTVTLTPTATSAVADVKIGVKIYLTDASGLATDLNAGDTIILTKSVLSGSGTVTFYDYNDGTGVESDIDDGATVTLTSADDVQDDLTYWRVDADNDAGGTWRVTANLGGALDPMATAATTGTLFNNSSWNFDKGCRCLNNRYHNE